MKTINRNSKSVWLVLVLLAGLIIFIYLYDASLPTPLLESIHLPGWVYPDTVTPASLKTKYESKQLRVLLVPGHDNDYGGTEFNGLREADLNLQLAEKLYQFLTRDDHFQVLTTRDFQTGQYVGDIATYFITEREGINGFQQELKNSFNQLMNSGQVTAPSEQVQHNFAPGEVALRLYGLNKWANEQQIDLMIHIHFNDYPRASARRGGQYSGFAIYVPEKQYPNGAASIDLARTVSNYLAYSLAVSDLPIENAGVVEDQELIAVGARASREGASILVEYGYIYESPWHYPETREVMLEELAWQTYRGLKSYFDPAVVVDDTLLLPYPLTGELGEGLRGKRNVSVLQKALQRAGFYPPIGRTMNGCPINGNFGPCVAAAVRAFQSTNQIPATGYVGPLTLKKINELPAI